MKTSYKTLFVAGLVSGLASFSLAGPGFQYWQQIGNAPALTASTYSSCDHMLAPNTGPTANKTPVVSVQCTPELMKTNPLCQKNCGIKTAQSDASCTHMLVKNTGPNADRVPFASVACTPELKANDPACQGHCRL